MTEAKSKGVSLQHLVGYGLGEVGCQLIWYKLDDKRVSEIRADLEAGKHACDK